MGRVQKSSEKKVAKLGLLTALINLVAALITLVGVLIQWLKDRSLQERVKALSVSHLSHKPLLVSSLWYGYKSVYA